MNILNLRAAVAVSSAAAVAFILAVGSGAAAQAQSLPEGPVKLYLKEHVETPLGAADGSPRLTADYDQWRLRPVEAFQGLGSHQIVHADSGWCLTADAGGEDVVPVFLVDCADAVTWSIVYDDRQSHHDYRLITPDGHYLGTEANPEASEGAAVYAVRTDDGASLHSQEWLMEAASVEVTPSPSSSEEQVSPSGDPSEDPSESPKPALPTTGTALGAGIGAGVVALAGGTALVLWWQRRRALRADW
ncbi:RICIN domain-containing protein [Glycomyces rhizosphaerae]|uniref:RICIN domain-containing protein n=1 Tax=Glycomyces rhizosphaerae TaxID=2054422 RepID=A0ABV7Q771_9ACTN